MRKGRLAVLGFLTAATLLLPGFVSSAAFAGEQEEPNNIAKVIVDKMDRGTDVIEIEPAVLSNKELIEDKYFESYTSIIAVQKKALGAYKADDLSRFLVKQDAGDYSTGLNILVVQNGSDERIYVSSITPELEAEVTELLGSPGLDGGIEVGDAGWQILQAADAIYAAQKEYNDSPSAGEVGIIMLWILGGIGAIILVIWGIVSLVNYHYANRWKRQRKQDAKRQRKQELKNAKAETKRAKEDAKLQKRKAAEAAKKAKAREANAAEVTSPIEKYVGNLREVASNVSKDDPRLSEALDEVLTRFVELRESLTLMETPKNRREILYVEYEERLGTLANLLGPRYYEDILTHPEHWREPQEKLDAIRLCVEKTAEQVLENIRQLKEGSEFDFELAIDSILGFKVIDPKQMLV